MAKKVLALNEDGKLSYCTCPPELRGTGRCNHVEHQRSDESLEAFLERMGAVMKLMEKEETELNKPNDFNDGNVEYDMSQSEIDSLALSLDSIVGQKLTLDNYDEILNSLGPEQIDAISKIAFEAAPKFSLPIVNKNYYDEAIKNQIYFANLPDYKIAGNMGAITEMFETVGEVPIGGGESATIESSYQKGLTPEEYFLKEFSARDASINKSVETEKPGYTARKLFYALSDIRVIEDCGGPYVDALHCKAPEGCVCQKCAKLTQGGNAFHLNDTIGGWVSTNMSEALTQLSMKQKHVGSTEVTKQLDVSAKLMATLDAWGTSPIIQQMKQVHTTEERRQILYEGLKKEYLEAGIKQDDINIMITAKKLTSYKRDQGEIRPVQDGECCDIMSMLTVGKYGNIFKISEQTAGYKYWTKPKKWKIKKDSSNQLLK